MCKSGELRIGAEARILAGAKVKVYKTVGIGVKMLLLLIRVFEIFLISSSLPMGIELQ